MVVKRKVSTSKILIAFVITVLIFSLGITLGMILDNQRVKWSNAQAQTQKLDYESLQWQYLFLTTRDDTNETCILLQTTLEKSVVELGRSLEKIQIYNQQTKLNGQNYDLVEREYTINNLKYWLLASKTKKECGVDNVIVLYFFSEKNCDICPNQGVILTYYKKLYQDKLLVFPINVDLEENEPDIKMLRNMYNVNNFPSIVVDNTKYEGVVDSEKLGDIICDNFKDKSICQR